MGEAYDKYGDKIRVGDVVRYVRKQGQRVYDLDNGTITMLKEDTTVDCLVTKIGCVGSDRGYVWLFTDNPLFKHLVPSSTKRVSLSRKHIKKFTL